MTSPTSRRGPVPKGHRRQPRALRFVGQFLIAVLAVGCVCGAVAAAQRSNYVLVLLYVATLVFWLIPAYFLAVKGRLAPRVAVGPNGLVFRPDRRVDLISAAMTGLGAATYGAWAVLGIVGVVTFPLQALLDGEQPWPYFIFFGTVAGVCLGYLVVMIGHRGTAYLRLTPDGYAWAEGFSSFRGDWTQVVDVTNAAPMWRRPGTTTAVERPNSWCPITFTRTDGTTAGLPNATLYSADGEALRELVSFYWQHPEHRIELTDERSLARLAAIGAASS